MPYHDLNTDKKNKRMTKSLCNLRQPMLIYATDACASGLPSCTKSCFLKQLHSILPMKLDKTKGYLSMMFQLLFKESVFLDIIEQVGTRPRSKNSIILNWSL